MQNTIVCYNVSKNLNTTVPAYLLFEEADRHGYSQISTENDDKND